MAGNFLKKVFFLLPLLGISQNKLPPNALVNELGCGNCHSGVDQSELMKERAPDLSYAGLRYNEAFLFDYLKAPQKVRKHIGYSRMPDYDFSDDEALALTKYLMTRKLLPLNRELAEIKLKNNVQGLELIHNEYQCTSCHELNEYGQAKSTDLTEARVRLQANWLYDLILKPSVYVPNRSPMPNFFNEDDSKAKRSIEIMIGYLNGLAEEKNEFLNQKLNSAIKTFPLASSQIGELIFLSQNCQSCHTMNGEINWFKNHNAPNLTHQRMKTPSKWLDQYLENPSPIRPHGYFPGTGSRMPNFDLNNHEVKILSEWIGGATSKTKLSDISEFQSNKVKRLLDEYFPCLGCHELNGTGGKIGPSFDNVGERLTDGFIKMAIEMPHMVIPESIMPKTKIDPAILPLVQSYLANQKSNEKTDYLNLTQNPPYPITDLYIGQCSSCHGLSGNGNGFNAQYLIVKPGDLTDGKKISQRPDDTLFDTIYGGGRIMNKNHFMPAWGEKISREEIASHVLKIRQFCECEPPDWSRD